MSVKAGIENERSLTHLQGISGNNTENEKNMLQKNMPAKFHSHPAHKARLNSVLMGGVSQTYGRSNHMLNSIDQIQVLKLGSTQKDRERVQMGPKWLSYPCPYVEKGTRMYPYSVS